ncbi:hypothetical protein J6590_010388 [Homalodisca vitripennis]|nr:hypothetical protein J6590_010388 [Homalodisca vitripennis]
MYTIHMTLTKPMSSLVICCAEHLMQLVHIKETRAKKKQKHRKVVNEESHRLKTDYLKALDKQNLHGRDIDKVETVEKKGRMIYSLRNSENRLHHISLSNLVTSKKPYGK